MAANRIKGINVEIGGDVTGLNKALKTVNGEIRDTQSQLKDVERLLKLDPTNTELLAQKQRLLSQQIEATGDKLKTLRTAEQQVQQQFAKGEVSREQYEGLQREIAATEIALKGAKKSAYDMQEQLMQSASDKALRELEDAAADLDAALKRVDEKPVEELADAADQAEGELKDVADAADDAADSLKNSNFGDVLSAEAIVEGVGWVVDAVGELRDEVAEYQRIMASLEVSSQNAGYTADQTAASFRELYGVLGNEQTSATTLSNLQAMNLSQEQLNQMLDGAIGAWATYGDSIPIDSLSEAINETVRTGTVTGTFADVLNWAGTSEDAFNEKLAAANNETERANLVLQELADQGLVSAGEQWQSQNENIVAANEAQLSFMENAAQLSETLAPIFTAVQEGLNQLFEALLNLTEGVDINAIAEGITAAFSFLVENGELIVSILAGIAGGLAAMKLATFATDITNVITGVSTLANTFPLLSGAISLLTNPIFLVGAAIVGLVTLFATSGDQIQAVLQQVDNFMQGVFAVDFTNIFGPVLGNALNAFMANAKNVFDSVMQVVNGLIDFIRGVFTGDWQRAWQGVSDIFGGIFSGLVALAKSPINAIIGLVNSAIGAINGIIRGINSIKITNPFSGESIGFNVGTIGSIPYLANGGILSRGSAIVGEAGPELLTVAAGRSIVQPLSPSASSWQPSAPGGTAGEGITYKDMLNVANVIVQAIENNGAEVVIGDDVIYRSYNRARDSEAIVRGGLR